MPTTVVSPREASAALAGNKLLRNTYSLLAMTLLFSAFTAGVSLTLGVGHGMALVANLVALGLIWFVLPRTANSAAGLGVVFAITGLLGFGLGPMLNQYLKLANGLLISGFILFDTSRIINGGETNYVMATISLYLNIFNLFISLLQLLGIARSDD